MIIDMSITDYKQKGGVENGREQRKSEKCNYGQVRNNGLCKKSSKDNCDRKEVKAYFQGPNTPNKRNE